MNSHAPSQTASPERPSRSQATFRSALRDLPRNGLLQREWRSLLRRVRNPRWWFAPRLLEDYRAWGLPVLAWFAGLPYFVWGVLVLLDALGLNLVRDYLPVDVFRSALALLPLYLLGAAVALLATTIASERERETWETLRATAMSQQEVLLGFLVGRLGPLLAGFGLVSLIWVLARSHYAPLLQAYSPFLISGPWLTAYLTEQAARLISTGTVALAVSAWSRNSARAVVGAFLVAVLVQSRMPLAVFALVTGSETAWDLVRFGVFGFLLNPLVSSAPVLLDFALAAVLDHLALAAMAYWVGLWGLQRP